MRRVPWPRGSDSLDSRSSGQGSVKEDRALEARRSFTWDPAIRFLAGFLIFDDSMQIAILAAIGGLLSTRR